VSLSFFAFLLWLSERLPFVTVFLPFLFLFVGHPHVLYFVPAFWQQLHGDYQEQGSVAFKKLQAFRKLKHLPKDLPALSLYVDNF
jgi:hypothetical protein